MLTNQPIEQSSYLYTDFIIDMQPSRQSRLTFVLYPYVPFLSIHIFQDNAEIVTVFGG